MTRSLFPLRRANCNPNCTPIFSLPHAPGLIFPSRSSFVDVSVGLERCLLQSSSIHSAADPRKLGIGNLSVRRKITTGSTAIIGVANTSAEAAAVAGSLGSAPSFLYPTARYFSELFNHYGRCYWELSKARLSMLVVATSGAGYVLGSGHAIDFTGLCCTCAGTMMVAASANTLNQVFEVQNDAKMKRTMQRPLPSGRITVRHAVIWASSMGIAGTALLACKANYLASGLAASNLFLYAFMYTPLKQIHPANTWIGAVVGAIPPLLGWAAAAGDISLNAMLLPAALYFWQIPHFMALAYLCRNDYVAGGFQMISFADTSGWRTAWISLRNCLYLLPLGFLSYDWGLTSKWFALESSVITLFMGAAALLFVRDRTAKSARRMFHASLLYLPVFMSGMLLHRLPKNKDVQAIPADAGEAEECEHESRLILPIRPPVAYASAAPFPFLPVPIYASTGL